MAFVPGLLRRTSDLRRLGIVPPGRDRKGRPAWVRVRRGVWYPATSWGGLERRERYAALVHATAVAGVAGHGEETWYFSHASSAAIFGMPRIGPWPEEVHVTTLGRSGSSGLVRRHTCEGDSYVFHQGLRLSTPARTVVDLARESPLPSALAAADFALREDLCTQDDLIEVVSELPPRAPGLRAAQLVSMLADARAMSVGESLSRAQMYLLNLPRPDLQVRWEDDDGLIGYTDFGWDGVVGEFDGKVKYGASLNQGDPAAVVWREKLREDRLRARGARVARWVWADALSPRRLASRLAAQGVRPRPRNTWLDGC